MWDVVGFDKFESVVPSELGIPDNTRLRFVIILVLSENTPPNIFSRTSQKIDNGKKINSDCQKQQKNRNGARPLSRECSRQIRTIKHKEDH